MNFDGCIDADGNPITREWVANGIRLMLGATAVTADEFERMVDYMMAHESNALHSIAAVLGTCCHCVDCVNEPRAPLA